MHRGLGLTGVLLFTGLPGYTQQVRQATIVEVLPRNSQAIFIQGSSARRGDTAQYGQQIRTAAARAALRFDIPAGVRLGSNSSLVVGADCIRLTQGKVLIAGQGRRGCVGSVVAVSRATVYTMELDEAGQGKIVVLEGAIAVSSLDNPTMPPVVVNQGESLTTSATAGTVGTVQTVSPAELNNIVGGPLFEGFREPLPDLDKVAVLYPQRGFNQTFLRDALTGRDTNFDGLRGQPSLGAIIPTGTPVPGIYTRVARDTVVFTPLSGAAGAVFIADIDNGTLQSVNGLAVQNSTFGLSGNSATGTILFPNNQVLRLEVFGVDGREPRIAPATPSSFPGTLTPGLAPDR